MTRTSIGQRTVFFYNVYVSELLLQTKLNIPPLRPLLVERTHIIEKINEGLLAKGALDASQLFNRKLSLISAPAGFGKTTLMSSWIRQLDMPAAWLSLDEGDNEPNRFVYYMIASLQEVQRELGASALSLLQSPQPPPIETLLTLLINDLASMAGRVILVFDDYHVIRELDIHQAITFLLDNQPPQFHLVIISRSDPVFPLHRLRGSGQMMGIYVRDLRFTSTEVASFLNKTMGLALSREEVATLARRTEGWVAGLQLAALSMLDMPDPSEFVAIFAGDDRYISDYLIGEVFERQTAQVQEFLLKTAILDRFCAPLCDAILGAEYQGAGIGDPDQVHSSRAIIERLDQSNLFIISLDNKREWYRYHHLFADFLRLRLRDRPAAQIAVLRRHAAGWYSQRGFTEEAIQNYLAAKDFAQAADLIEGVGIRLIVQGQLRKILDWLADLPDDFICTRPLLCVCQAWILNVTGQAAAAEPLLQEAEQTLPTIEPEQARHVRGLIDMIRAYRARRQGNLPSSIQLLRQASENLSPDNLLVRSTVNLNLGFNYLLMGQLDRAEEVLQTSREEGQAAGAIYVILLAMAIQANNYVAQGKLNQAIELFEEAIAYGLARNRGRPFPPAGYAYAGLGQVMYERDEGVKAEQLLVQAVQLGEILADWSMVRRGLLPLIWLRQMAGDPAAAQKLWQQAFNVVHQAESERVEAQLVALRARLQLKQAASDSSILAAAAEWAVTYRNGQPVASSYQEASAQMTLAQVEMAQGQIDQAILRLKQLAETAAAGGQSDNLIKIQTLQAITYDAKGDDVTALERLGRALALAATEGYVRTFVDHGPPMQRLLQEAATHGLASDYVARLLAAFPPATQDKMPPLQSISPSDLQPVDEPLKDQEIRILRLMSAGLSNREIADELYLSVNTIKVYASRVYRKLGVHRRGEAVARAEELGIL
jgi:LuxR family maltose regulon positive regulatory protein